MKSLAILIVVFLIFLSCVPCTQAITNSPPLGSLQIFPPDNIWNVPIDTLPVDPKSADYVRTIGGSKPLALYWGGIPYNVVPGTQPKKKVSFKYASDSDNILYPMPNPDSILIENSDSPVSCTAGSGHDCHVLIVDKDNKYLYELFAVNYWPGNGSWTAGSGAHWNLSDNQLRKRGLVSADAGGLPILPGLVRYEEVKSGKIDHALRFSSPLIQKTYVWPARTSSLSYTNTLYPPSGQRFRLKASFDTSGYPPYEKTILEALKKYGMILADKGAPWYISTSTDSRWSVGSMMRNLSSVKGSDFEAVDTSSLNINPDSGITEFDPWISVTAPNGGESLLRGSSHTITWRSSGTMGSNVKIELLKGSSVVQTISSSTPDDGSFSWTISTTLSTGSDYRIRISGVSSPTVKDSSNSNFSITGSIIIILPNGGQSWVRGSIQTISWTSTGTIGSYVKIELLRGSSVVLTISSSTPNDGSFSWRIPTGLAAGSDYRIRISSVSSPKITDTSNNNLAITESIIVTSPNGGQSWARGSTHAITWTSTGSIGSYVKIDLMKGGTMIRAISSMTPNDGSFSWTITTGLAAGSDYRIRVSSTTYPATMTDTSNSNFIIT